MLKLDSLLCHATVPARERVADRLADVLIGLDEILDALGNEEAAPLRWIEACVLDVSAQLDDVMRRISN